MLVHRVNVSPYIFLGMAMYRTGLDSETQWPDIQLSMISVTPAIDGGLIYRNSLNLNDELYEKYTPIHFKDGFFILPVLVHPKSRGTIKLRSRNPEMSPEINPNYFDHPLDMKRMIQSVRFSQSLGRSRFFQRYGAEFYSRPVPQCQHLPGRDVLATNARPVIGQFISIWFSHWLNL